MREDSLSFETDSDTSSSNSDLPSENEYSLDDSLHLMLDLDEIDKEESEIFYREYAQEFIKNGGDIEQEYSGLSLCDCVAQGHNIVLKEIFSRTFLPVQDRFKLLKIAIDNQRICSIITILSHEKHNLDKLSDHTLEHLFLDTANSFLGREALQEFLIFYNEKYPKLSHYKIARHIANKFSCNYEKCPPIIFQFLSDLAYTGYTASPENLNLYKIISIYQRIFAQEYYQITLQGKQRANISLQQILSPENLEIFIEEAAKQNDHEAGIIILIHIAQNHPHIDRNKFYNSQKEFWAEIDQSKLSNNFAKKDFLKELLYNHENFFNLRKAYYQAEPKKKNLTSSKVHTQVTLTFIDHLSFTLPVSFSPSPKVTIGDTILHSNEIMPILQYHKALEYLYNTPISLKEAEQTELAL